MITLLSIAAISFIQTSTDPLRLPIGRSGEVTVQAGQTIDLQNGKTSSVGDIVQKAQGKRFVFLGESHTNPEHHKFQASVIDALAASGRTVVVGFEMFTRPVQEDLDPWTMGWWSESEFIEKSDWKHQWGYNYKLYKPIFDVIRERRVPMVALNIPRTWVHAVGTKGFDALTADQRAALPTDLGNLNPEHRRVFDAMIGGHPMGNAVSAGNMYSAQVLWDQAMADTAIKYLASHPQPENAVFVVVAGSGHVMYGQGINWRIEHRTGEKGVTVVMVDGDKPATVSRGLGDFVYCGGVEEKQ